MDWSERGWSHVLVFPLSMLAKLKHWVHRLLEMQNPLLLLDCLNSRLVLCVLFSLRLCVSESLGVSLAHRFCLAPVRLQFEQCSWLWWDYSHLVLWHYVTSWVHYQVDILSSFFCVVSVIAFLTAESVKCGNSFEKHERFFFPSSEIFPIIWVSK